jgi:hypothetical protein
VAQALATYAAPPFTDDAFQTYLAGALADIETLDSDGDGHDNWEEIMAGTHPGDAKSLPSAPECPASVEGLDYAICRYDPRYALRKIALDFCGVAPSFEEFSALDAMPPEERPGALHAKLAACLDGEFWLGRDGVVWGIAHRKIRPVAGLEAFASYENDYAYFTYTQIDDHDVRDVLIGTYLVKMVEAPTGPGGGVKTSYEISEEVAGPGTDGKQPMQPDRRAGLLTTAWPLFYNTMFTAFPRGTAAQAYRAFLSWDIARSEGLFPVPGEPQDYDGAGVGAEGCRDCHSTLDPLAQVFKNYNGLQPNFYEYDPLRIEKNFGGQFPGMLSMPESGLIFGEPVADLRAWAQKAAAHDRFYQATVGDYWRLLLGEPPPEGADQMGYEEYTALWQGLAGHRSVEQMLHQLIDTEAYGAP